MGLSIEEKQALLSSSMNQYIFDTIFTQNNNGKIFDYEA
jgi:hypothetical protein